MLTPLTGEEFQSMGDQGLFLVVACIAVVDQTYGLAPFAQPLQTSAPDARLGCLLLPQVADLAAALGIETLPSLLIMRERVVLYCETGVPEVSTVTAPAGRAARMDMPSVHAELQCEQEAEFALHSRRACPTTWRRN